MDDGDSCYRSRREGRLTVDDSSRFDDVCPSSWGKRLELTKSKTCQASVPADHVIVVNRDLTSKLWASHSQVETYKNVGHDESTMS